MKREEESKQNRAEHSTVERARAAAAVANNAVNDE